MQPGRILVVKRDKIGDMLLTTPLLAHLREALPRTRIEVLCTDYNGWVLDGNPDVDERWELPRVRVGPTIRWSAVPGHLARLARLRRARYDAVLVAQGEESPRAVRLGLSVRAARVIAYARSGAGYGSRLTDAVPEPPETMHEIDRMLALARALGLAPPRAPRYPSYVLPERARRFAQSWLAERGIPPRGYVLLGLGARRAARQPDPEQIERWSRRWRERHGLQTVFVWTPGGSDNPVYPGDDAVAERVLRAGLAHVHPYRGPLIETLGLLWLARTSVIPDSGLMHFGAASPGGVVGLFARTGPPPARWAPRGPRARWIQAEGEIAAMPDATLDRVLEPLLTGESPTCD